MPIMWGYLDPQRLWFRWQGGELIGNFEEQVAKALPQMTFVTCAEAQELREWINGTVPE